MKKKLTVESIGRLITFDMCKYKNGEEILINLLKQIREDLKNEFDKGLEHSEYVVVDKVFNKYLNEKGGK